MRRPPRRQVVRALAPAALVAALAALAVADPRLARGQAPAAPPGDASQQDPCPAIDEGFVLCSGDPWSGNCAQFVAAAGRLAQLYQIQADDTPDRVPLLLSTNWWGCGDATLEDMQALLLRIGTPDAQAVLRQPPFSRLPPPGGAESPPGEPRPPPRPAPRVEPDCANAPTTDARVACASRELAAARSDYRSVRAACRERVALPLRDAFDGSEMAFEQELPAQCEDAAPEDEDAPLRDFARSQCLAEALRERTRGMLAAHPECRTPR